ncbi:MAG: hypothetical protein E7273_11765 [Pseudobutyrivibrio ruminis]|nr:hypothetical protein [Pseudobutyrivibrio ruminis]
MKKNLLFITLFFALFISFSFTSKAAGFVPAKSGSTIGYYFLDADNTQFYYDGFVEINGVVYGFEANGLTNALNQFSKSDPNVAYLLSTHHAKVYGSNDIMLNDGALVSTSELTNSYGTFKIIGANSFHNNGIAFSTIQYAFTFEPAKKYATASCQLRCTNSAGAVIGGGVIKAKQSGTNYDTGFYPDGTAKIELIQ